ncbi:MAG: hypothetical protein Q8Q42_01310 [Nanoarchaeota archaeon]|nr:hypothetical protein [Nanoarchaeota archaeon]
MDVTDRVLCCGTAGAFLIAGLAIGATQDINAESVKIFRESGKPTVMRIYRSSGSDVLLVEDSNNASRYVSLDTYLKNNAPDEYSRKIGELEIKRRVDW